MIEVTTPSRLHFGLLAFNPGDRRQFGGAGLMVAQPGTVVRFAPAPSGQGFTAQGRMADRVIGFAKHFVQQASFRSLGTLAGADMHVLRIPRPHTGLGSGTQLGMVVAMGLARMLDRSGLSADELAALVGRGQRSAIGAHGFLRGGFLVDGGKSTNSTTPVVPAGTSLPSLSPLVMRHDFPEDWRIVLIRPRALEGIAGDRERRAFRTLPPIPPAVTDHMCRLVLLDLAPALLEHNLDVFGEALYQLQQAVGRCFASVQGGIYADPLLDEIVRYVRDKGIRGIGQSSWGPTLYAITGNRESAEQLAGDLETKFSLTRAGEVVVTMADNKGAVVKVVQGKTAGA
jgi:beta-RFAP synthase